MILGMTFSINMIKYHTLMQDLNDINLVMREPDISMCEFFSAPLLFAADGMTVLLATQTELNII